MSCTSTQTTQERSGVLETTSEEGAVYDHRSREERQVSGGAKDHTYEHGINRDSRDSRSTGDNLGPK